MFRFHQFSAFMYSSILLRLLYTFLMVWTTLWQMVRTHSGKGVYDDVLESSTHHHGTIRSLVSPPSPPMPPVSLEQLLVPLNAIVQRLAAIDESQAGRSQYHQQPQDSSYLDFLQHTLHLWQNHLRNDGSILQDLDQVILNKARIQQTNIW
jgi:hypothetical protein